MTFNSTLDSRLLKGIGGGNRVRTLCPIEVKAGREQFTEGRRVRDIGAFNQVP